MEIGNDYSNGVSSNIYPVTHNGFPST